MREHPHALKYNSFERRHTAELELGGATTQVVDTETIAIADETPILVAPGYGASIHTNAPMLEMIAREGRRVISLNQPSVETAVSLEKADVEKATRFIQVEVQKASNLLELIDKKGIERVNALAFSEGALNALIAAYLHPEKFSSIILAEPAGLIGKSSLLGLGLRFQKQVLFHKLYGNIAPTRDKLESAFPELDEEERAMYDHIATAWKDDEAAVKSKSKMLMIKELWSIGTMQIDDLVAFVRAAGVKVVVIGGVDDYIFGAKQMAEHLGKDSVNGFLSIRGAHAPHYSARVANHLFDLLEAKRPADQDRTSV